MPADKPSAPSVAQYFDALAAGWDDKQPATGPIHQAVATLAGVKAGSRVLDLGCGTGIMLPAYLQLGAGSILAMDLAPGMIDLARSKFAAEPRASFLCADVLDYKPDPSAGLPADFDAIVIYNAYPHFLDKTALCEKIASLLAPNGRFLVAHGMGREALNTHHSGVPASVSSDLGTAKDESRFWMRQGYCIDIQLDTPFFYAFGGSYLA